MKTLFVVVAACCAALASSAASATEFDFSFYAADYWVSGTIAADDSVTMIDAKKAHRIVGLSGTVDGNAIDVLYPTDYFGSNIKLDNYIFEDAPYFSDSGFAFGHAGDNPDNVFHIYSDDGVLRGINSVGTTVQYGYALDTITISQRQIAAAVPEPATWAMMLFGFGMIAAAARYRRRSVRISLA